MKKIALLFFVLSTSVLFAQAPQVGTRQWADPQQRNSNPSIQDGNGTLGFIFDSTDCGLNYTQASVKLGQRAIINGAMQPAPFAISGIPFCAQTVKAYLWCVVVGSGAPITATVVDPFSNTLSFPMTIVGQDVDTCWGPIFTYRADVTSIVNGNGNYIISGLPVSAVQPLNDANGATLMIIYKDLAAGYTGSIHIDDGCLVTQGQNIAHAMNGFNSCTNSTSGNAFMIIADLQNIGAQASMNNAPLTTIAQQDWWDFVSAPVSLTQFQASCAYSLNTSGDCATLAVTGLYTQTTCSICPSSPSGLTVTAVSVTPATCPGNGAATIAVTGGSGSYTITWNTVPIQTGFSAINLTAGIYSVDVVDSIAGMCSTFSGTIPYNGPVPVMSTTALTCSSPGSATVNVTGGTAPYAYSWLPTGGTAATANNLPAGTYTVNITDSTGCIVSAIDSVLNASALILAISTSPDNCSSPAGSATVTATGQAPYSYLWQPGGDTTVSVSNLAAGTYTVNVTDSNGCFVSSLVTINESTLNAVIPAFSILSCGVAYQLSVGTNNTSAIFSWQPAIYLNNPNLQSPIVTPYSNVIYTVTVTTPCDTTTVTAPLILDTVNPHNESICMVTVDTAIHKNVLVWQRWSSPGNGFYNIYRETSPGVYVIIATQPINQLTTYTDVSSTPTNYPDRYRISTVDSCGFESMLSPDHRGLCLQLNYGAPSGYELVWTPYYGVNVLMYRIYRGTSPSNLTLLASVSAPSYFYNDANPPFTPLIYMVEAVYPNGSCVATFPSTSFHGSLSNLASTTTIGVNENEMIENSFALSPNPGHGNFQLSMSIPHAQEIQVVVYDQLGRNVYSQNENAGAGMFSTTMNLSSLSNGVYSVQVKTAQGFATRRLVIN